MGGYCMSDRRLFGIKQQKKGQREEKGARGAEEGEEKKGRGEQLSCKGFGCTLLMGWSG